MAGTSAAALAEQTFKVPHPPSDPPVLGPQTQEEATANVETPSAGPTPQDGIVTPITSIGPPTKNKKKRKKAANQAEGNNAPGSISAALSHAANLPTTSAAAAAAAGAALGAAVGGYDAIGTAVEQFKASLEAEAEAAAAEGIEDPAYESGSEPPAKKLQIMISPGKAFICKENCEIRLDGNFRY